MREGDGNNRVFDDVRTIGNTTDVGTHNLLLIQATKPKGHALSLICSLTARCFQTETSGSHQSLFEKVNFGGSSFEINNLILEASWVI